MVSFDQFLATTYFGNTGQQIAVAVGIFIGVSIVLKLIDTFIIAFLRRQAKKTRNQYDDIIIDFLGAIHWQFYFFIGFYIGARTLTLSETVDKILGYLLVIFVVYYLTQGLFRIVDYFTKEQVKKRKETDNAQNTSMIKVFGVLFKIMIYVIAVLMVLANFGIEITPLIASLGVGGIAIAIALQTVLADLFAAFAIYFDKPFKEGDFVIIGNDMGVIKHIGIKTTRIQALGGQELVVSNSEMTNSRVNNYKKMEERRVAFGLGVEYSTPHRKMKKINSIVEKAVKTTKHCRFDRAHFKEFANFSLNFEVVYYVDSSDYNLYMDVQQEINLKIMESFEKEGIVFAFPTQTLHIDSYKKK